MAHFAEIQNNIVIRVLVVEQEFINKGILGDPKNWVQTSYNTRGGIHYDQETGLPSEDQSKALRKNYAGIGYTYDEQRDAFIPPKHYPSWILNEDTCIWDAPIPKPEGLLVEWNEELQQWINF